MTSQARSQPLLQFKAVVAGFSTNWRTPENHVTLVKAVQAVGDGTNAFDLVVLIANSDQSVMGNLLKANVAAGAVFNQQTWVALGPGEYLWAWVSIAGPVVWISGAVLLGPNQFPPAKGTLLQPYPAELQALHDQFMRDAAATSRGAP